MDVKTININVSLININVKGINIYGLQAELDCRTIRALCNYLQTLWWPRRSPRNDR